MAVYAFDQRGFGSAPQRGIWAGGAVMADDVWHVARMLRVEHPTVPLYGLAESMGGAVMLYALQRHSPGWIDGAALLAPAVWNRAEMSWYARLPLRVLAHSWRGLKVSSRSIGRTPSDDPETLRQLREDPLVGEKTRVDMLWGISELMDAITTSQANLDVPLLILYGGHDEIMPPVAICAWLSTPHPGRRQFAFYPNSWHLLTRGLEAPLVHADLAAWFEHPSEPLPSAMDAGAPIERLCAEQRETQR
jgi:alpha-beta hydrolase superfamily lysophospholipase